MLILAKDSFACVAATTDAIPRSKVCYFVFIYNCRHACACVTVVVMTFAGSEVVMTFASLHLGVMTPPWRETRGFRFLFELLRFRPRDVQNSISGSLSFEVVITAHGLYCMVH